jgi:hypothetical protein
MEELVHRCARERGVCSSDAFHDEVDGSPEAISACGLAPHEWLSILVVLSGIANLERSSNGGDFSRCWGLCAAIKGVTDRVV